MFDAVNNITNEELQFYLDLLGYGGSGDVPWLVMEAQDVISCAHQDSGSVRRNDVELNESWASKARE